MSSLIVIRIVPKTPTDPQSFTTALTTGGGLKITVATLSFASVDNQPPGANSVTVTVSNITPSGGWGVSDGTVFPQGAVISGNAPSYQSGLTGGIIQQVDYVPSPKPFIDPNPAFELQAVATAVIQVPWSAPQLENVTVTATRGNETIALDADYYVLVPDTTAVPDLTKWNPSGAQADPWAQLSANLYLSLPPAPPANPATSFQMPSDGSAPPFDPLLTAVKAILALDPGSTAVTATVAAGGAPAGATQLPLTGAPSGVTVGVAVSGTGIAAGTTVAGVSGSNITLSQEVGAAGVAAGTTISFTPSLGSLTLNQCQNIAYELLWTQQPPLPGPPDPIESLYTNPPNNGSLMSGGTNPNTNESDRQQFEAQLKSYYASPNANAAQLTTYVYALSAAIACEQMSLAATQALIQFPSLPGSGATNDQSVILTALDTLGSPVPPAHFGVPAGYFYAIAGATPTSRDAVRRYGDATGDQLAQLLSELTEAINAGVISDAEPFVASGLSPINAAQAARRIRALGVPQGSSTALAPLGTIALAVSQKTTSGTTLTFSSVAGLTTGLAVTGPGVAPGTTVSSLGTSTPTVTLSAPLLAEVKAGATIVFTPAYPSEINKLVNDWLAFPSASGGISSQSYQLGDDDALFWPDESTAQPLAFLELVLCALTSGYIIPAPFSVALGSKILTYLTSLVQPATPTVATLAQVTQAQWTALFKANPTWLPPQSGGIGAQINAFIETLRSFFPVGAGGPISVITIATSAPTASGNKALNFAPGADANVKDGWSVSCPVTTPTGQPAIAAGTLVDKSGVASTTVTLNAPVNAIIPALTPITFRPTVTGASAANLPGFAALPKDWLVACLQGYDSSFVFGKGISDPNKLASVAGTVFPNDPAAQAWLQEAFIAIDALCAIVTGASIPVTSTKGQAPLTGALGFSIVEALYACGFQSAADITVLTEADFTQAVLGTPAFDSASAIYNAAASISKPPPAPPPGEPGFHPINPDGSLTDCIPPESLSPLGPVAYLADLLSLSEAATCEDPKPATGTTLGDAVKSRRGPLASLTASAANLETPLPLIDLVNECLESMVVAATPVGAIYDTAPDKLAGFALCQRDDCGSESKAAAERCHDPARIFAALPEHSTPADPTAANSAVEPAAYAKLENDFSTPLLPYSQPLDVSRSILRHFGSCRFETMRSFRRCITEFVFSPASDPPGFDDYVWRLPVRIDIAIEYLGITPEEYTTLFHGTSAPVCWRRRDDNTPATPPAGVPPASGLAVRGQGALQLPVVLADLGLSYCELFSLWQSKFVSFGVTDDQSREREPVPLPECEPCCLDRFTIAFPRGADTETESWRLFVFVRLWRKLKELCCCGYTFDQLSDICEVLQLFTTTGTTPPVTSQNPEFIRQLAAFQMLRDDFHLPLAEAPAPGVAGVARTPLLALWTSPPQPTEFTWAVHQLVAGIARHARRRYGCERHAPEFLDHLASELDELSRLAGFDPTSTTDNWHAAPTHTLRFAEILAKLIASPFRLAEVRYLFTVDPQPDRHAPFPPQDPHDALVRPLDLPEHRHEFSLLALRHRLLEAEVGEEELEHWHWQRVAAELRTAFGFADADVLALGSHFFPRVLEHAGIHVPASATRFTSPLTGTTPSIWNTPPNGPFQYDPGSGSGVLWTTVPLEDAAVLAKLAGGHDFSPPEQAAIQDLYFQPRAMLARFGLLFADFLAAVRTMVEAHSEDERWHFFRRSVVLCARRRRLIAEHLHRHVRAVTGAQGPHGEDDALLLLNAIYADENSPQSGQSWENQNGNPPLVNWTPPNGGALAGLLALVGTGLVAEYATGGSTVWRDPSAALDGFGHLRDRDNCPVPTVLPALNAPPPAGGFVTVHNGLGFASGSNEKLGGAQGFKVTWTGALLIEREGHYEFRAGAPRGREHRPDFDAEPGAAWRVTLQRGSRSWVVSSRAWPAQEDRRVASHELRPGAYGLTIELTQPGPDFTSAAAVRPRRAGLELAYAGPDTDDACVPIPHRRLFAVLKDAPLTDQLTGLSQGATDYLGKLYVGSLRDIRRTYQRVFKALLFAARFALRAEERANEPSELGYMLDHGANFAGTGFKRTGASYDYQKANFDFNLLPVLDDYHSPAGDLRANPSPFRVWAMFDCWERVHDYVALRKDAHRHHGRPWRLFERAANDPPSDLGSLLREIGALPSHWPLDLRFFQAHGQAPYAVTDADLEDERWTIRAWRADRWLDAMQRTFAAKDVGGTRPDLWADDDPAAEAGQVTGNGNLLAFLCASAFARPERAHRYEAVRKLTDGLRLRARDALAAYLCAGNRTLLPWGTNHHATAPIELSALLLMDVEIGIAERASRIEEAITAVQTFVRRARLGLEQGWTVSGGFARLWDSQFATFQIWRACAARHLYKENWLEWTELPRARRTNAFRLLEKRLEAGALTVAEPGGDAWWPHVELPDHEGLPLAERVEPMELDLITPAREGLGVVATPQHAGRPSWLAALDAASAQGQGNNPNNATSGSGSGTSAPLPLWMQAAIRLGVTFVRLAAAGAPVAAHRFAPVHRRKGCVECCASCGREHEPCVDEYYFWLIGSRYSDNAPLPTGVQPSESDDGYEFGFQDDFYDATQQQSAYWQDPTQLPQLLAWNSQPMVRLAWCRVHNGEYLQPQRSMFGVAVQANTTVDLKLEGRTADSLFFTVSGGLAPQGYADPSPPGFRYDLAEDAALTLPQVAAPAAVDPSLGGLPAYPWFVYAAPGCRAFPLTAFSPALAVAHWLRAHCRFEAALRWSRLAFDPVQSDCAWIRCPPTQPSPPPPPPNPNSPAPQAVVLPPPANPYAACCDSADVSCEKAEQRAILLFYLETLVEWGHAMMRRRRSREASQQARVIFDAARRLLGRRPVGVRMPEPQKPGTVGAFKPAAAPLNPRLLDLYDRVADQLALIHLGEDARRLLQEGACFAAPYFGDSPLRQGWRSDAEPCIDDQVWCHSPSPYRFTFLIQKALEYCGKAQELAGAVTSVLEKGDAEYVAALRARNELELLHLARDSKQDQWREADWQVESLQKTKEVNQADLTYTDNLIAVNLIDGELEYQSYVNSDLSLRSAANAVEAIGEGLRLIPDFVVGAAGFGGSPVAISWLPLGTKLGDMFAAIARIMNNSAQIDSETAALDLTQAGWTRRYAEWVHQHNVKTIEIQQNERQKLGAQRHRDQMLLDLNTHQRQIEQSAEVDAFLRDKFTHQDLYLYMHRELAAHYYRTFDLALEASRQAERAFNLERGHTTRRFLADCRWNDLREGLTAAEQLSTAVRRMEKAYFDENVREYELTKHISLRLSFPFAFLALRTTGRCEIEIPEWMFDLDFPGHCMRRIRAVSLTLPAVAGAYTGVHCRLTLIDSMTRVDPRLDPPAHHCCCPPQPCDCDHDCESGGYALCPDDPRMVRIFGEREAIATSEGQNDSGLFELSFNDPRYLPFEYMGAVSRWRLELPPENNYFAPDSLTEAAVHFKYTSREGGEALREAATRASRCRLPGDGWAFFDMRHDFQDAWELMRRPSREEHRRRTLAIHLSRRFFPYLPHDPPIRIECVTFCFQVELERACPELDGCPCPEERIPGWHKITLRRRCPDGDERRWEHEDGEEHRGERRGGDDRRREHGDGEEHRGERRGGDDRRREHGDGEEHRGERRGGDDRRREHGDGEEHRGERRDGDDRRWERGDGEEHRRERENGEEHREEHENGEEHFLCYAEATRRGLYIGATDLDGIVFRRDAEPCHLKFEIPAEVGEITEAYLIVRYAVDELCCCDPIYAAHAKDRERPSRPDRGQGLPGRLPQRPRAAPA